MRYKPFYPGDKVITITDYDGTPSGTTGKVASRWAGTVYVVRLPDGSFRWLNSIELGYLEPSNPYWLTEGKVGVVTSDEHKHHFAKSGGRFLVVKVAHDVDYYGVVINDELKWFTGFQLAKYI